MKNENKKSIKLDFQKYIDIIICKWTGHARDKLELISFIIYMYIRRSITIQPKKKKNQTKICKGIKWKLESNNQNSTKRI